MKGKLPDIGQEIITKMGKAKIVGRNIMKGTVVAQLSIRCYCGRSRLHEAVMVNPATK